MSLSAAARCHSPVLVLVSVAALVVMMSLLASALDSETCFSRQHQSVTVNVRQALSRAAVMNPRLVHSERDCVLACCSEDVQPGSRCNMAIFKTIQLSNDENCLLFHCPTELDCPLMKAQDGTNTYNIYKGLTHPPTLRPVTMTTTVQPTTSTTLRTPTASAPTTVQTTTQAPPTTTQAPPTITQARPTTESPPSVLIVTSTPAVTLPPMTTTTITTTRVSPTLDSKKINKSSKNKNKTTKKGKPHPVSTTQTPPLSTTSFPVLMVSKEVEPRTINTPQSHTETTTTAPPTTTTTPPTTTTAPPSTTTTPLTTTTTPPITTTAPPTTTTTLPTITTTPPITTTAPPTTTTTLPTTTTTTPTTTTPPTTSSTPPLPDSTTTTAPPSLIIIPKDIFQPDHGLQSGHALQNSSTSQGNAARGALRSGLVVFMVLGLTVLTLALALGGRKAMESFDRRHYTRLELNDLHYEI